MKKCPVCNIMSLKEYKTSEKSIMFCSNEKCDDYTYFRDGFMCKPNKKSDHKDVKAADVEYVGEGSVLC